MNKRTLKKEMASSDADIKVVAAPHEGGFRAVLIRGGQEANGPSEKEAALALAHAQFGDLARVRDFGRGLFLVHFNQEEPA